MRLAESAQHIRLWLPPSKVTLSPCNGFPHLGAKGNDCKAAAFGAPATTAPGCAVTFRFVQLPKRQMKSGSKEGGNSSHANITW